MRLFLLLSLLPSLALAATPPTRAALRRALEADERAAVVVEGPRASGRGTLVGAGGQVLTVVDFVSLDTAKVKHGGALHEGRVLSADATSRLAFVACEALAESSPVAASPETLRADGWVIAVVRQGKKKPEPRALRLRADGDGGLRVTKLPPATPLYDAQGRLVGLVTEAVGKTARVLPVSALRAHVRRPFVGP